MCVFTYEKRKIMGISDEFKKLGAKQKNVQWSVSAFNSKNELVLSLWEHYFTKIENGLIYNDKVSRWSGLGNQEFRQNFETAYKNYSPIRVIISKSSNPKGIENGESGSQSKNTFHAKTDWIGKILLWDGDNFSIEFRREK